MKQNTSMLVKVLRLIATYYENILFQSLDEMLLSSDRIQTTAVELSYAFLTVHIKYKWTLILLLIFSPFPGFIVLYVRYGMVLVST